MRVLLIGSGGVGDAAERIAAERDVFERWVVADHDASRLPGKAPENEPPDEE
ncbi:MAG: hypothetical protein HOQ13_08750 [Dermatophilaceae bacterium]|nr:hypothetical protein [Dermatophilaceae bacterium]